MASDLTADGFSRPHALIADDSRIVRATLCKHLSDIYAFSEALDGEDAWEFLLRNESIELLITDLTMPRLDGYGLLRRMRASGSDHLRDMPVVVVSGTDDADERRQARDAGATDLITKGMPTGQLLSRMTLLAQLVGAQRRHGSLPRSGSSMSPYAFQSGAETLLADALRHQKPLALLSLSIAGNAGSSERMLSALASAIRQTDLLAATGMGEYTVATANLDAVAARSFADRLCNAARTVLAAGHGVAGGAGVSRVGCGVATLDNFAPDAAYGQELHALWDTARRRGKAGTAATAGSATCAGEESAFGGQ